MHELHDAPSPECRNVACGQAIDTPDALDEGIARKKPVIEFVRRQVRSTRPVARRTEETFMSKHSL
jgi:hypothetical protein